VLILVAFYNMHELQWGYSLLPATTWGTPSFLVQISRKNNFITYSHTVLRYISHSHM